MTDNPDIEAEPKSPAQAFDDLRREVAFLRKVIEPMAERTRILPILITGFTGCGRNWMFRVCAL